MLDYEFLTSVTVPIIVAIFGIIGTLIGLFWTEIQASNRRRIFEGLILREIQELTPYPSLEQNPEVEKLTWGQRIPQRKFVHQDIFNATVENKDFILSLNPDLVYYVKQLWSEIEQQKEPNPPSAKQFHFYLDKITLYGNKRLLRKFLRTRYSRAGKLKELHCDWNEIFESDRSTAYQSDEYECRVTIGMPQSRKSDEVNTSGE